VTAREVSRLTFIAYDDQSISLEGDLRLLPFGTDPLLAYVFLGWLTREEYLASTKAHIGEQRISRRAS